MTTCVRICSVQLETYTYIKTNCAQGYTSCTVQTIGVMCPFHEILPGALIGECKCMGLCIESS